MTSKERFGFTEKSNALGEVSLVPHLPFSLSSQNSSISVLGLLDTGASVNVLPYELGLQLGLDWDSCETVITLAGNLANFPARGVILSATIDTFAPVLMVFDWTQAKNVPLLLGRINFLQEFNVCFYGSQLVFEIAVKSN